MKTLVLFVLSSSVFLCAQDSPTFLRGEVNGAVPADRLYVELYEQSHRNIIDRVPLSPDGRFEINGVHTGTMYEIRIVRSGGERVYSEEIQVSTNAFPVSIHLPEQKKVAAQQETGSVSMYRLRHQVPAKAMNEFKRAEIDWTAGKQHESIERLQHALKIDPGYVEAHNNLGTKLLVQGQAEMASVEFRKALELDPNSAPSHLNLAICLMTNPSDRQATKEAEEHARRSLQLDPEALNGRYVLGMALSLLNKEEALPYLRASAEKFPRARLAAANMLERMGRKQEARQWRAELQASPQ